MNFVCPGCGKDIAGYAGEVRVVPSFDGAVRSYTYKDVSVDLEQCMSYFPLSFFEENPSTTFDYFPNISVEITCPFCDEQVTLDIKNEEIDEMKSIDRGVGGSGRQTIFDHDRLRGKAGPYDFQELHIESDGEYRGVTTFDFSNIGTAEDLRNAVENAAVRGFHWFQSEDDPELAGSIYGSLKESNLYKEDVAAYVHDAFYLAQNKRYRDCCEILFNARENMKELTLNDINKEFDKIGEKSLVDFVKKYFADDEEKYGEKVLTLFKVKDCNSDVSA